MAKDYSKPFYNSKEWQKVRSYVLMRDNYKCQKCGRPAQEVHHKEHIKPENIWDIKVTLNPDNLISLCKEDHFAEHEADKRRGRNCGACGEGFHFDETGQLVPD